MTTFFAIIGIFFSILYGAISIISIWGLFEDRKIRKERELENKIWRAVQKQLASQKKIK